MPQIPPKVKNVKRELIKYCINRANLINLNHNIT